MSGDRTSYIIPVLLIAVGIGWLLGTLGFGPQVLWVWTFSLGALGILAFVVGGFDKVTVVIGPIFLLASVLSYLRQSGQLSPNVEVPGLMVATGLLLLLAHHPSIPVPLWLFPPGEGKQPASGKKPAP